MTWRAPTQGGVATVANIAQPVTITINAVATAQTAGLTLENTTAAAAGAQQYSPMMIYEGQGWDSTASLSKLVEFAIQNRPVQAAGNPTGVLDFLFRSNAGAWTTPMTLDSAGKATVTKLGIGSWTISNVSDFVSVDTGYIAVASYGFRLAASGGLITTAASIMSVSAEANIGRLTTSQADGATTDRWRVHHPGAMSAGNLLAWGTGATWTIKGSISFDGLLNWTAGNEQLTVGAAGAASAPPATPTKYIKIKDSAGTTLVVPCYAAV